MPAEHPDLGLQSLRGRLNTSAAVHRARITVIYSADLSCKSASMACQFAQCYPLLSLAVWTSLFVWSRINTWETRDSAPKAKVLRCRHRHALCRVGVAHPWGVDFGPCCLMANRGSDIYEGKSQRAWSAPILLRAFFKGSEFKSSGCRARDTT